MSYALAVRTSPDVTLDFADVSVTSSASNASVLPYQVTCWVNKGELKKKVPTGFLSLRGMLMTYSVTCFKVEFATLVKFKKSRRAGSEDEADLEVEPAAIFARVTQGAKPVLAAVVT